MVDFAVLFPDLSVHKSFILNDLCVFNVVVAAGYSGSAWLDESWGGRSPNSQALRRRGKLRRSRWTKCSAFSANNRWTLSQIGDIHESQSLSRYLTARALLEYSGAIS